MKEGAPNINLEDEQFLKNKAIEELRKKFTSSIASGRFYENTFLLTVFEHLLIGSTIPGQGILDKNTPISKYLGGDESKIKEARKKYFGQEEKLAIAYIDSDGTIYQIWFNPKIPEQPADIDNIDWRSVKIEVRGVEITLTEAEKETIVKNAFQERQQAWEAKRQQEKEKLKNNEIHS